MNIDRPFAIVADEQDDDLPSVSIGSLEFSGGSTVHLEGDDIVAFVGPNNAGKSQALREIEKFLHPGFYGKVIRHAEIKKHGSVEQIHSILERNSIITGVGQNEAYSGYKFSVNRNQAQHFWQSDFRPLVNIFCSRLLTESRITDSNPPSSFAPLEQPPQHPIHLLYTNDEVEKRLSKYFRQAFGEDLFVHRLAGSQIPLLVGQHLEPDPDEDRLSLSYVERLQKFTVPLKQQGDGMRSFASVMLHMLTADTQSIILLDEPEAFLHPPQARLLAEFIAKHRPKGSQLFLATHSPDVLQGLLEAASDKLKVLRVSRTENINHVSELNKENAKSISSNPLMKYSSVFSGIFHKRAFICESDADCLFYQSILDLPEIHGDQNPDVLFLHAAGKHRMAQLARTLHSLSVHVSVIADMDILIEEKPMEDILSSLGADWTDCRPFWSSVKNAVEGKKSWLTSGQIKKGIEQIILDVPTDGEFPTEKRSEISSLFRKSSPWDIVKQTGRDAIPHGTPTEQFNKLYQKCAERGFWIVPKGELEGFCRSVGGHGPTWVQKVLESKNLASSDELASAREFVSKIWNNKWQTNFNA